MALEKEVLVAIQLEKFKNIELFKQGLYQIRVRVSYEVNKNRVFARPIKIWTNFDTNNNKNCSRVLSAHILDKHHCFNSRIMLVRYQEETVSLLESCIFSCKIPEGLHELQLKIHTDLYFTNLETKKVSGVKFRPLDQNPIFKCVVNKEYTVVNGLIPLSHYLSINFDPKFFCCLESLIHIYTSKYLNFKTNLRYKLFGNSSIVGGTKVDKVYLSLIEPLYMSYNNIRKIYQEFSEAMVVPKSFIPNKKILPFTEDSVDALSFHESISSHDPDEITEKIISEVESVADLLEFHIEKFLQVSLSNLSKVLPIFKVKYQKEVWQHFQEYIHIEETQNLLVAEYSKPSFSKFRTIEIRDGAYFNHLEALPLQAEDLYKTNIYHPIFLIHSDYTHIKSLIDNTFVKSIDIHLMVLVHGYKGSALDMHMIKGYINLIYPSVIVYSSKCNENFTDCNIELLGENLAEEILNYLNSIRVPKNRLKLSFVGHSMGGLVLRACLPGLFEFKSCMHSFITFSSPHIGIIYTDNIMLKFGKWALKKMQNSDSFRQMIMKDSKTLENSFLYKLSNFEGLDWFKHVLLFVCDDDPYVPLDSAGIYVPPQCFGTDKENAFKGIVESILSKIGVEKLIRIDVNFKHKQFLDNCMCCGNRHIDFLDDPCFIKMFCYSLPKLFI